MADPEDIKILKERLLEAEQNCVQAAEFGKALLEENVELKTSIDNMTKQYTKKIEALEQDNYSQSLKIEAHVKDKKWFGEEINQLKNMHAQKQQQDAVDRSQGELAFKKQINELKSDYDQAQAIEKQLKEKIEQLEELLQQQLDQTQISSRSFNGEELNELQDEILKLKTDNTALTAQMIDAHTDLKCSQDLCASLKSKLVMKDEEIQEIQCNMTSYCNNIEKLKTDNSDLSAQLEALRMETNAHNNKGNSIFSELEDRRVEAEKRLISLRVKNDSLKEELVLEKQLHQKSKSQMVLLLNMNGSRTRGDSAIESKLYAQLDEARTTIKELTEKLEKYEDCEKEGMKVMSRADFESKVENGDKGSYEHFLRTMLETKESEVTQLNSELRHKNLQFLDVSNKLLLQEKKVVEMEKKQNLLQNQNFKLNLKNEELLLKHEPENVHNHSKKQTFKKEKLPIFEENVEPILTLKETCSKKSGDLSGISSSNFKSCSKKADDGNKLSSSDQASSDTVNVDGSKPYSSYLTASNKMNVPPVRSHGKSELPYRRTVKISNDLEVMDTEGNIEKQVLADDDDSIFPRRLKAAPKPSTEPKVKQVEIDPEKVIQCNPQ